MRRGKRAAFVSISAAVVVVLVAVASGAAPRAGANRLDDTLRTNQVQVLATHNSYHIQQDVPIASPPTRNTRTRRSTSSSTWASGASSSTW